jgi:ribosomal protein S18 acetylase RimI-like enzyme
MIRPAVAGDAPAVVELAVAAGLFPVDEVGVVEQMMGRYLAGAADEGHVCVVDEESGRLVAVAYYEPVVGTDRAWELVMIGVHRDHHRKGRGRVVLRWVEDDLRDRGQRLLLVETSSGSAFAPARAFYRTCGYDEEARVRDYFEDGDDMVLFRKSLTA